MCSEGSLKTNCGPHCWSEKREKAKLYRINGQVCTLLCM